MKSTIKTSIASFLLLLAASCTKEITKPADAIQLSENVLTQRSSFTIGQSFGGGIIFYIDTSGKHGLIAATSDQGTTATWYNGTYTNTGATGTAIGSGARNTNKIIKSQSKPGNYAALLCSKYTGGGFTDWFLPAKDELNELYKKRSIVGGFEKTNYWSSTEANMNNASNEDFQPGGFQFDDDKNFTLHVRAVRAF